MVPRAVGVLGGPLLLCTPALLLLPLCTQPLSRGEGCRGWGGGAQTSAVGGETWGGISEALLEDAAAKEEEDMGGTTEIGVGSGLTLTHAQRCPRIRSQG